MGYTAAMYILNSTYVTFFRVLKLQKNTYLRLAQSNLIAEVFGNKVRM